MKMKQSQLAARYGVTARRIRTLTHEGRLPRDADKLYDVAAADALFATFDPARRNIGKIANGKEGEAPLVEGEGGMLKSEFFGTLPGMKRSKAAQMFHRARVAKAKAKADEIEAKLISRKEIEYASETAFKVMFQHSMKIPQKLTSHLSERAQRLLQQEIDDIMAEGERMLKDVARPTPAADVVITG